MIMVCYRESISESVVERDVFPLIVTPGLGSARCWPLVVQPAIESRLRREPFVAARIQTLRSIGPVTAEVIEPVWEEIVRVICQS